MSSDFPICICGHHEGFHADRADWCSVLACQCSSFEASPPPSPRPPPPKRSGAERALLVARAIALVPLAALGLGAVGFFGGLYIGLNHLADTGKDLDR